MCLLGYSTAVVLYSSHKAQTSIDNCSIVYLLGYSTAVVFYSSHKAQASIGKSCLMGYLPAMVLYSYHIAQASIGNYLMSVTQLPTLPPGGGVGVRQNRLTLSTVNNTEMNLKIVFTAIFQSVSWHFRLFF